MNPGLRFIKEARMSALLRKSLAKFCVRLQGCGSGSHGHCPLLRDANRGVRTTAL